MNIKSFLLIIFYLFFNFLAFAENLAEIRAIDRITGRSFKLKVPIDTEVTFSNLVLNIKYCYKNPKDKEIENFAYLIVKDKLLNNLIFQGAADNTARRIELGGCNKHDGPQRCADLVSL